MPEGQERLAVLAAVVLKLLERLQRDQDSVGNFVEKTRVDKGPTFSLSP